MEKLFVYEEKMFGRIDSRFTPVLYFILSRPGGGNFRHAGYILAAKAIFLALIQHV